VERRSSLADRVLDEEQVFGDASDEALRKRRPDLEDQEVTVCTPTHASHDKEVDPVSPLGSHPTPPASAPGSAHGSKIQEVAELTPPAPAVVRSRPATAHDEEKSAVA